MSPTKKPAQSSYPYTIRPFTGDYKKIGKCPAAWVNEFFFIEALLRSPKVMAAFQAGGEQALTAIFIKYGVDGQAPLKGSHHALLSEPLRDKAWDAEMAQLGDIDTRLGIIDLGILARLPPNSIVHHGNITIHGFPDNLAECLAYLRDSNPRFLCLRIDTSAPPTKIIERLRPLLRNRHEQAKKMPPNKFVAVHHRQKKTPFRSVKTWLQYLQCYDLRKNGLPPKDIEAQVYPGDPIAHEKVNVAIKRVLLLIKAAEDGPWPPHNFQ